jgi:Uma2 family endonuclease
MHARRVVTTFTESQYLAMEAASDERHELIDGQIVAMAGGSRRHSAVCHAVGVELTRAMRGRGCVVFQSDLRLVLHASGSHVYPDLQVVCGVPSGPDDRSIDNPTVVV